MTAGFNDFFYFRLLAPILLLLPISPIIKVILVMLTDMVDCKIYKLIVDSNYDSNCFGYQMYDKLLDMYTNAYIMFYLLSFKVVNPAFRNYILAFFILRTIGTLLFVNTNKTIYLKVFPDAIREYMIFALCVDYLPTKWRNYIFKNINVISLIIYFIKALFECYWHKSSSYPVTS